MPEYGFLKIDGADGSCGEKNFEKHIYVYEYDLASFFDFNQVSASKVGDQKWNPVRFVCKLEETAPEIMKMYRKAKEVKIEFKLPTKDKGGTKKAYFVFTFEKAQFVSYSIKLPNTLNAQNERWGHVLEIGICAQTIKFDHIDYEDSQGKHRKTGDQYDFADPTKD